MLSLPGDALAEVQLLTERVARVRFEWLDVGPPAALLERLAKVFGPRVLDPDAWQRGVGWIELDEARARVIAKAIFDQVYEDLVNELPPKAPQ